MNLLLRSAVTLALALGLSNAEAAGTSSITVSATATPAYTDLGAAPVWMSVVSPQPVQVIVADTIPTAGAVGSPLSGYVGPQVVPAADGSSHVWVAAQPQSSATIFYSPAPSAAGGGGGSLSVIADPSSSLPTYTAGAAASLTSGLNGQLWVDFLPGGNALGALNGSLPTGNNTVGSVRPAVPAATATGFSSDVLASLTTASVVKSSAGLVVGIQCDILSSATNSYAQILNTAASPALGTNVIGYVPLTAGASGGKLYQLPGLAASTGISVGIATTPTGSTAAGTAGNCEVDYE